MLISYVKMLGWILSVVDWALPSELFLLLPAAAHGKSTENLLSQGKTLGTMVCNLGVLWEAAVRRENGTTVSWSEPLYLTTQPINFEVKEKI